MISIVIAMKTTAQMGAIGSHRELEEPLSPARDDDASTLPLGRVSRTLVESERRSGEGWARRRRRS